MAPLFFIACQEGHTAIALVLINHGGSIIEHVNDGNTHLHSASHKGHTDVKGRPIIFDQVRAHVIRDLNHHEKKDIRRRRRRRRGQLITFGAYVHYFNPSSRW